ncbi:MAG: hypothetical protein ABFS86_10660 [Planctomycetota bacterium]
MERERDPHVRRAERMAARLVRRFDGDPALLRALADALDRRVRTAPLERLVELWGLSGAEAARFFGVSRQAFSQWLDDGPPVSRATAIAELATATDLLDCYLKRERIPAVVRREAPMLSGRSLIDMAREGLHREVREAVERMFDLRRVQP